MDESSGDVQEPVAQGAWFGGGELPSEEQLLGPDEQVGSSSTISIHAALASKLVNGIRSSPQSLAFLIRFSTSPWRR